LRAIRDQKNGVPFLIFAGSDNPEFRRETAVNRTALWRRLNCGREVGRADHFHQPAPPRAGFLSFCAERLWKIQRVSRPQLCTNLRRSTQSGAGVAEAQRAVSVPKVHAMDGDRLFYAMIVLIALMGIGLFAIPVKGHHDVCGTRSCSSFDSGHANVLYGHHQPAPSAD
jgi:hypothetical protein